MTLVERLVRIPSPSGGEAEAAACLVQEMDRRGFRAHLDEAGNAVGTIGGGPLRVCLAGHIDTVPGALPVRVAGGVLHGRGSVDAKGALAVFVEAAARGMSLLGPRALSALTLSVVGCVGEEADSPGAKHLLSVHPAPDFVVIGEPSGWDAITLGYKGSITLQHRVDKPLAHRGAPVTTPAEDAVAFYGALCAAHPQRGYGFGVPTLRLVALCTGGDGVREWADARLNVRTPPGFDLAAFRRAVDEARGPGGVSWGEAVPPVLADKHSALVRALLAGVRGEGGRPRFVRKTGTSDMNLLQAWGVPMAAYGPGDSALDHTPEERLDLSEYARAIAVLARALEELGAPALAALKPRLG